MNVDPGVALLEGFSGGTSKLTKLNEVKAEELTRMPTGIGELDRVLGGGFVFVVLGTFVFGALFFLFVILLVI